MICLQLTIPILRIFSVEKAREFYIDYLGFALDWEHRFEPELPMYMQVHRDGIQLHLSEHHGDATPGSTVYIRCTGLRELHAELRSKGYNYLRPDVESMDWGDDMMTLTDPFGNSLRFAERRAEMPAKRGAEPTTLPQT